MELIRIIKKSILCIICALAAVISICIYQVNSSNDAVTYRYYRQIINDYDKIKELHGELSEKEIYDVIWKNIKEVNKKLTSYKAIKALEIKEGEFEKTSTMKIKRYKELNNK